VSDPGTAVSGGGAAAPQVGCCPLYHEPAELTGRRWSGAFIAVRTPSPEPLRFSEIGAAVPDLSDRLLSERLRELEERGLVVRHADPGPPARVTYAASDMGRDLEPALEQVALWARRWLAAQQTH
jgi:DNA-binding HxlR family transcriptional regulator